MLSQKVTGTESRRETERGSGGKGQVSTPEFPGAKPTAMGLEFIPLANKKSGIPLGPNQTLTFFTQTLGERVKNNWSLSGSS